jgi:hypothetical protein
MIVKLGRLNLTPRIGPYDGRIRRLPTLRDLPNVAP